MILRQALLLIMSLVANCAMASGEKDPNLFKFEVISVEYNYGPVQAGVKGSLEGTLNIKVKVEGANELHVRYSRPFQVEPDIHIVGIRPLEFEDTGVHVLDLKFVDVQWGTYFYFDCFAPGTDKVRFGPICSNDYVSEEDKELLFGSSGLDDITNGVPGPAISISEKSIIIHDPDNVRELQIYSLNGQSVCDYKLDGSVNKINLAQLEKGIYLIVIKGKGIVSTKKIVL